eukprot:Rhum_TRINITY_DN14312_c22_g1::Rhum_TRINITY_DN14312_c22_g1_i1::g.79447::m.79447
MCSARFVRRDIDSIDVSDALFSPSSACSSASSSLGSSSSGGGSGGGGPGTPELVAAVAATPVAAACDADRAELLARLAAAERQRDTLAESHRAVLEALGVAGCGDDQAAAAAALCAARQQHEELGRLRLALRHERRGSARQLKEAERREADGGALREELRAREAEETRLVAALAEAKARNAWADAVLDRLGVAR